MKLLLLWSLPQKRVGKGQKWKERSKDKNHSAGWLK